MTNKAISLSEKIERIVDCGYRFHINKGHECYSVKVFYDIARGEPMSYRVNGETVGLAVAKAYEHLTTHYKRRFRRYD